MQHGLKLQDVDNFQEHGCKMYGQNLSMCKLELNLDKPIYWFSEIMIKPYNKHPTIFKLIAAYDTPPSILYDDTLHFLASLL